MRCDVKAALAILLIAAVMAAALPAVANKPVWDPNSHNYPQTVWSDQGMTGSVAGRVTNLNGTGIGGAYVSIVNASNVSQEYYNTTSDINGNFKITGLNATYSSSGQKGPDGTTGSYSEGIGMYRAYANKSPYGEGYSAAFGIDANQSASAPVSIVLLPQGSCDPEYGPRTAWSDAGRGGVAMGRVTGLINGTDAGISGVRLAVVNAFNYSQEYYNTTSDAGGYYAITGLNATYSSATGPGTASDVGTKPYVIYVSKGPYGEGSSAAFGVDAYVHSPTYTAVILSSDPARIELSAERPYVYADGQDNIRITATMYDTRGNPVKDGYPMNFTVGNATNNAWSGGYPFAWTYLNGSINSNNTRDVINIPTSYNTGGNYIQFGWAGAASGNSTIWAYYDQNASVFASINISLLKVTPNASIVNSSLPAAMLSGQNYSGTLTVKNTGNVPWDASSRFRLGAVGDARLFGPQRYAIAPGVEVLPGREYTFTINMTAPAAGNYTPQYRMVWEGKEWFGETLETNISVEAPKPGAAVTYSNIPYQMVAGRNYTFYVTMTNTGNVPWDASSRFRLGAVGDARLFGPQRYAIAPGIVVMPGHAYTWRLNMTAPAAGSYQPQYRMVWEGKQWFGEALDDPVSVRVPTPDAVVVSASISDAMIAGKNYTARVTVRNTGDLTWKASSRFRLGAVGDARLFGPQRYAIAPGVEVLPGREYTFTFNMTAPAAGSYQPQYRMVWEGKQWFGETPGKGVIVRATGPDAVVVASSIPGSMDAGKNYTARVTVRNTGDLPWDASSRFRLGAVGDARLFGPQRYAIAPGIEVHPGDEYTWTFNVTAPAAGVYQPQYRMVWEGKQWFGETLAKRTNVSDKNNTISVEQAMQSVWDFMGNYTLDLRFDGNMSTPFSDYYTFRYLTNKTLNSSMNASFSVNRHTGAVASATFYNNSSETGNSTISLEQAQAIALGYAREKFAPFARKNMTPSVSQLVDHGAASKEYIFTWNEVKDGVYTTSYVSVNINAYTGKVNFYLGIDEPVMIGLTPDIPEEKAVNTSIGLFGGFVLENVGAMLYVDVIDQNTQKLVWWITVDGTSYDGRINVGGSVLVDALDGNVVKVLP